MKFPNHSERLSQLFETWADSPEGHGFVRRSIAFLFIEEDLVRLGEHDPSRGETDDIDSRPHRLPCSVFEMTQEEANAFFRKALTTPRVGF